MATVSYTFVERCAAGGHTTFDVSFNGGANKRVMFETDQLRDSLANIPVEQREETAASLLRIHFAGRSRAQIVTELNAGPVVVTI